MRRDDGQASLEYLGVVALVAAVLGLLAVPALAGGEVGGAVVRGVHRALCVVRGGVCDLDRRPCVVAADERRRSWEANLLVARVGRRRVVLREQRSDGTVAVTWLTEHDAGGEVSPGAGVSLRLGRGGLALSATVRAAALARVGHGRVYVFGSARAADAGMAALAGGRAPAGATVQRLRQAGAAATAELALRGGAGAALRGGPELVAGELLDEATGRRTVLLRARQELALALEGGGGELSAGAGRELALSMTLDRGGQPLELALAAAGELHGAADLPGVVAALAPGLGRDRSGGRRWELEQRLDLTEPGNAAAAGALLRTLADHRRPDLIARAAGALGARFAARGVTDVRAYESTRDEQGLGGHLTVGLRAGAVREDARLRTRLLAARQRGGDGLWRRRDDCLSGGGS